MTKKFIKSKIINDYDVLTDDGWVNINAVHKTIEYDIWYLETENYILECADKHIVFYEDNIEVFVMDLKINDKILTKNGLEKVLIIKKTNKHISMYDLELDTESNKRYYTNDILSHNTTYIRYLIKKIKTNNKHNNILYFPPTMVGSITEPGFINFISEWVSDSKGKNYLLIEDAEPLLESRNQTRNIGITNLLNLTDGILNDVLSIQIIATFNTNLKNVDDALLRPERLLARKEFKPLTEEKSLILAKEIGVKKELIKGEMSLADIYTLKKETKPLTHDVDEDTKRISF